MENVSSISAINLSREDIHKISEEPNSQIIEHQAQIHRSASPNTRKQKSPPVIEDKLQRELAEIITDFKNNVHSLAQVSNLQSNI